MSDDEKIKKLFENSEKYLDNKELENLIECLNKIIKLHPNTSDSYNNRGRAYTWLGNNEAGIKDFDKAIELNPNDTNAYNNKALIYYNKKDYDSIIENFTKIIEIDPNNSEAYNNRGSTYDIQGKYDKAIKDFDKAIELVPNNNSAYYNKAIVYGKKAINSLNESTELNRNESSNNISYSIEKYSESINSIKELIKNCSHIPYNIYFFLEALYKKVREEDVEEIIKYIINKQENAKIDSLYSYVPFDKNTIDSIMHQYQYKYASEIFNFNDPVDPVIRLIKGYENTKELFKKVRIACLSTDPLNMLMYSHYTDRHKGICIEYDFSNFNKNDMALVKVAYEEKLNIDYNIYELTISGENKQNKNISFLDLFATKHKNWEYESEYRIISFNKDKIKLPIKSIYLGKNMSTSDKSLVMSIAKNIDKKIKIYEVSNNDKNLFELEEKEINII